jgi:enamine deaminase RidA (YjgF/YER057c/UK114 family)
MPIVPETGEYVRGTFAEQTDAVMKNLAVVLAAAGSDWEHVLHCRIYLTDFTRYAEVNDAYRGWFPRRESSPRAPASVSRARWRRRRGDRSTRGQALRERRRIFPNLGSSRPRS